MKPFAAHLKPLNLKGNQLATGLVYVIGAGLLALALERFMVALSPARFLGLPDPVLGIPLRLVALAVGGLESLVAWVCLFGQRPGVKTALIAWLTSNFLIYQIGVISCGCQQRWTGPGALTDPLHLRFGPASFGHGFVLPGFLLVASTVLLLLPWLAKAARATLLLRQAADQFKMSCPGCGTHIKFASQNLGQKTQCPQCQTAITLRKLDLLKMTCFFCHEHIQFPSHSIGEKISCPHCQMDITLKEAA